MFCKGRLHQNLAFVWLTFPLTPSTLSSHPASSSKEQSLTLKVTISLLQFKISHISLLRKVRSSKSDFKIRWSHPGRSLRVQGLGNSAASNSRTVQGGFPMLQVGAITISGVAWVAPGGWLVSYPTRWSFTFILGPLHWSSIFLTSREQRNIVQLCTSGGSYSTTCRLGDSYLIISPCGVVESHQPPDLKECVFFFKSDIFITIHGQD